MLTTDEVRAIPLFSARESASYLRLHVSKDKAAWRRQRFGSSSRPVFAMNYFMLFVVIQICGAPFTPAFSIAAFSSGEAAKALAFCTLWKS